MRRWRWGGAIGIGAALVVGCTHDFDAFDSIDEQEASAFDAEGPNGDGEVDAAPRDSGGVIINDAACVPANCTGDARNCAIICNNNDFACSGRCGFGPGHPACVASCDDASVHCKIPCETTCESCAGSSCNSTSACTNASK